VWTGEGCVWRPTEFSQVVHLSSPGFPLVVHRLSTSAVHRFWITLVDNL
jgi:hypothetical protein